jgi:hypothetical protein
MMVDALVLGHQPVCEQIKWLVIRGCLVMWHSTLGMLIAFNIVY